MWQYLPSPGWGNNVFCSCVRSEAAPEQGPTLQGWSKAPAQTQEEGGKETCRGESQAADRSCAWLGSSAR